MQLLRSGPSPFVRKVLVTLHETGQYDDIEHVDVATTPLAPDSKLIAANPVGKIPALVRSDGPTIYDSRVICRFLDARAEGGLYPEHRIWDTLTLEAPSDGAHSLKVHAVDAAGQRTDAVLNERGTEVCVTLSIEK